MNASHKTFVETVIEKHFGVRAQKIERMTTGICNEVYRATLADKDIIVRLSAEDKFLMGSHNNIPLFKKLGIKVPDILAEDYSKTLVPYSYQVQSKIEGQDLGDVIASLSDAELVALANEVAEIFRKVKTIPASRHFGVVWGGENEFSDTWTERMRIWLDESEERGRKTGVMDDAMKALGESIYLKYESTFDSVRPSTYYGDICSKNIMVANGAFSGLVDLDGLTQGDFLEAIGRIKTSWHGTPHGDTYTKAVMDALDLSSEQREMATVYALLNRISWACENGIQFNQNTKPIVDEEKDKKSKAIIAKLAAELGLV